MSEPKVVRYAFYGDDGEANPVENPGGGWVDYDDYKALAARVEELEGWQEEAFRDVIHAKADAVRLREALLILATVGEHELLDSDADRMAEFAAEALQEKP